MHGDAIQVRIVKVHVTNFLPHPIVLLLQQEIYKYTNEFFNHSRVIAIFGSSPANVDLSVASVSSSLHIPHLTTSMKRVEDEVLGRPRNLDMDMARQYSIHLGPSQYDIVSAITDMVQRLGWSNLALITHRETGQ